MTLTKIAKLAETSVSTVSKAFSGSKEISEETRERIFRIAKEVGSFDKYYKAPRKNPLIAILVPEIDSECYGTYASIFEREFQKRGADTIIASTGFDCEREARLFRELAYGMRVDGIILWGSGALIKNPDQIPLVVFGEVAKESNADQIDVDLTAAILKIVNTIKEYGHTKVGFIGENLTVGKKVRFKKAMRKVGLPILEKYICTSEKRFADAGEDCMRMILDRGDVPSVIVAAYDQIAYGAMKYAREKGYRIPDDISFVGMDDISAASYFDVPLSSIHAAYEKVCDKICDLVFKRIENRHYRAKEYLIVPVTFNIRESLKNLNM